VDGVDNVIPNPLSADEYILPHRNAEKLESMLHAAQTEHWFSLFVG